ncbi:MAG: helix-turn-helix transcriptional regulator [bacterium]|nr:helix-turn-helix transcriptional regulator [bacterium]
MDDLKALGARFKKSTESTRAAEAPELTVDPGESLRIRGKMIGVLLRDARMAAGRALDDCARLLYTTPEQIEAFEFGDDVPSLPQLEILAYYLEVPVSHFWGQSTLQASREDYTRAQQEYMALRDRMIGALLRKAREDAGLSLEHVSQETGIDMAAVERYELGEATMPMHALSVLANAVRKNMNYFMESSSHLGELLSLRERWKVFSELPEDIRTFAANPLNVGFIEIAIMLSQMPVNRLRSVGESILNITL